MSMPVFSPGFHESPGLPDSEVMPLFDATSDPPHLPDRGIPDIVPIPVPEGRGLPPEASLAGVACAGEVGIGAVSAPAESISPLEVEPPNDLALPENIKDLVPAALLPSDLPSGDTEKFYVAGHPELVVRLNAGVSLERVHNGRLAANRLTAHGVSVLPSGIVEHEGSAFVVTKRVEGITLVEALQTNPTPELLQAVDTTWKGLADALVDCFKTDRRFPADVTRAIQYMVGTVAGDVHASLPLVDIPRSSIQLGPKSRYEVGILDIANELQAVEVLAGQNMPAARAAIEHALTFARDSPSHGDGLTNAVRYVLTNGVEVQPGDARLLRTR
jgi:hypothetical protein